MADGEDRVLLAEGDNLPLPPPPPPATLAPAAPIRPTSALLLVLLIPVLSPLLRVRAALGEVG